MRIPHRTFLLSLLFCVILALSIAPAVSAQSCCTGTRGNITQTGAIDLADLSLLIGYLTIPGVNLPCPEAANVTGTDMIDLADLSLLIGYLTIPGVTLSACPADTGLMDPVARMAAVDAVEGHIDSLLNLPTATFNQRVLSFIQGRPEFEASGVDSSGNNVWARFTDGVMYMIAGSFGPLDDSLPGEVLPSAAIPEVPPLTPEQRTALREMRQATAKPAAFDDLPFSGRYRVIQTVGSAFAAAGTTTNRLRSWLSANGYVNAGSGATVGELRSIGDEGVIFYVGHGAGGIRQDGVRDYGIWSSTLQSPANDNAFAEDLRTGRLCLITAPKDTAQGAVFSETHYSITSRFITHYWWDFPANAMVVITACASDSVASFRNAIQAKGGPAYFGWTATLSCKGGCYAAEFLFDRFLGANKAFPRENPEQRPFDVSKVFADLQSRNFHVQPGGDGVNTFSTTMRYHPGSSNFGLLAPSIQFMDLYAAADTLTINGIFGEDPGDNGKVTVNGTDLTIASWTPTVIKCQLPLRGPGSSGPVIVQKKAPNGSEFRKSNVVNISEWEGTFTQTREEDGTLNLTVHYDVRIRADIHSHRDDPGEIPFKPITPYFFEKDATADWAVGGAGQWVDGPGDITYDYEWAGSGNMPLYDSTNPGMMVFFQYLGSVDADQKMLTLVINSLIYGGWTITETATSESGTDIISYPGAWATTMDIELYDDVENFFYYSISLDNDYNIAAGSRSAQNMLRISDYGPIIPARLRLEWPTINVQYAPDHNEAQ
ncbi:MAG: hypothetical protein IPH75_13590 [bacterium]|nr:hypothetical protein [bacterium]